MTSRFGLIEFSHVLLASSLSGDISAICQDFGVTNDSPTSGEVHTPTNSPQHSSIYIQLGNLSGTSQVSPTLNSKNENNSVKYARFNFVKLEDRQGARPPPIFNFGGIDPTWVP
jgi:hypothetical protein